MKAARSVEKSSTALPTSQVAATLAAWMGVDWNESHSAAGRPIR